MVQATVQAYNAIEGTSMKATQHYVVVVVEDVALVVVVKTAQTLRRQMTILVLAVMRV